MSTPQPVDPGIDACKYEPVLNADCSGALRNVPLSPSHAETLSGQLDVLAQPERVQILAVLLATAEMSACLCDLQRELDLSADLLQAHLTAMSAAGLVQVERRGAWTYVTVRPDCFIDLDVAFALHPVTVCTQSPAGAPDLVLL